MLATIDDITAQKLDRDRVRYGQAFMRLNADGSIDRLDAEQCLVSCPKCGRPGLCCSCKVLK
jgi:hypothetical protein